MTGRFPSWRGESGREPGVGINDETEGVPAPGWPDPVDEDVPTVADRDEVDRLWALSLRRAAPEAGRGSATEAEFVRVGGLGAGREGS